MLLPACSLQGGIIQAEEEHSGMTSEEGREMAYFQLRQQ